MTDASKESGALQDPVRARPSVRAPATGAPRSPDIPLSPRPPGSTRACSSSHHQPRLIHPVVDRPFDSLEEIERRIGIPIFRSQLSAEHCGWNRPGARRTFSRRFRPAMASPLLRASTASITSPRALSVRDRNRLRPCSARSGSPRRIATGPERDACHQRASVAPHGAASTALSRSPFSSKQRAI